jgi:hypothetical protein
VLQAEKQGTAVGRQKAPRYYCSTWRVGCGSDQPLIHTDKVETQVVEFVSDFNRGRRPDPEVWLAPSKIPQVHFRIGGPLPEPAHRKAALCVQGMGNRLQHASQWPRRNRVSSRAALLME